MQTEATVFLAFWFGSTKRETMKRTTFIAREDGRPEKSLKHGNDVLQGWGYD